MPPRKRPAAAAKKRPAQSVGNVGTLNGKAAGLQIDSRKYLAGRLQEISRRWPACGVWSEGSSKSAAAPPVRDRSRGKFP